MSMVKEWRGEECKYDQSGKSSGCHSPSKENKEEKDDKEDKKEEEIKENEETKNENNEDNNEVNNTEENEKEIIIRNAGRSISNQRINRMWKQRNYIR